MFFFFSFFFIFCSSWSEKLSVAVTKMALQKSKRDITKTLKSAFSLSGDWDLIDRPEQVGAWISYVERPPFNMKSFNHWRFYSDPYITDSSITAPDTIDYDNLKTNLIDQQVFSNVMYGSSSRSWPFAFHFKLLVSSILDIHSPLHTSTLYSSEFPDGDRNGRDFMVIFNGNETSLYDLWETGCGMTPLTSDFSSTFWNEIDSFTSDFLNNNQWTDQSFAINDVFTQIEENKQYTIDEIYQKTKPGDIISDEYIQQCQKHTKEAMLLAAERLANFFEEMTLPEFTAKYSPSAQEKAEAGPQGYFYSGESKTHKDNIFFGDFQSMDVNILAFTVLCMLVPFVFLLIWKKHCGN